MFLTGKTLFKFVGLFIIFIFLINSERNLNHVDALAVRKPTKAPPATISNANAVKWSEMEKEEDEENPNGHTSNMLKPGCDPCPMGIRCVPLIQCPAHVRMKDQEKPQICDLTGADVGFCCLTGQNHTADESSSSTEAAKMRSARTSNNFVSMSIIEEARKKFEKITHDIKPVPVERGHPEFLHSMVFHSSPQEDMENFHISNNAIEQVITTQLFTEKENIPLDDIITNKINVDFKDTPLEKHCSEPHHCRDPHARYRSFDGSCNNALPHHSHWGAAGQPLERLLPPAYEDGVWTPRLNSVHGKKPLMGARQISRLLLTDENRPHPKYNLLHMQFGQFLAHDVSQTASVRTEAGELVRCCDSNGAAVLPPEKTHFACLPIHVEEDDEFYSEFGVRCMNFVRLSLSPNTDCKAGYGKQRSKVTHFLDASPVYGSSIKTMRELRTFHDGKLRMFNDFGHDLLPLTTEKKACESDEPGKSCFKSGDGRTNQIISLIVVHIIFAREHNRIADTLAHINPHLSDEELFQEARRIVIAELQHIIYNEYLPALIGPTHMKRFRLMPQHHGYSNDYSDQINPALTNEFSGAAFRMGHSTVDGKFRIQKHENSLHGHDDNVDEVINIPDVMFNPSRMRKRSFYDQMLNTLVMQPMQKADSSVSQGLTQYLFRGHNPFGLDLAAFNIQRGRDQGIRPYNDYLELLGHRKIQSFKQLPSEMARRLSEVYHTPDDIDLWVGGLLEQSVEDGVAGNTFAEIIADQFSRLKRGDRYFYEYKKNVNPGAFTLDQLHEIRKVTMARLLCDNADHWHKVPPAAFVRTDFPGNEPLSCDNERIPFVNLEAWRI